MYYDIHSDDCPCCTYGVPEEIVYLLPDPQPVDLLTAADLDLHVAIEGRSRAEIAADVHDLLCMLAMKLNTLDIFALNDLLVEHFGDFELTPDEALSL